MDHSVVVYPKIEDQICDSKIQAVTTQNTIFVFGGKMTSSGTMEREDGSGASESTDFPMVLKFVENYYPLGFDINNDCQGSLDTQSTEYTWVRVQAQRPSDVNGPIDEFKSTSHATAIQVNDIDPTFDPELRPYPDRSFCLFRPVHIFTRC